MLLRASRVVAWLRGHDFVMPEDIQSVFTETIMHRVFFNLVYEMRRSQVAGELVTQILNQVATP